MVNTIRWKTIGFGLIMALIDVVVLSTLKAKSLGWFDGNWIIALAMLVYSLQPVIFVKSLGEETLTVMNLFWDLASDVLVTLVGLFYFKEYLSPKRLAGVFLSMISLYLLSSE
jgi:multidrug transporter EmrE-like cation transporter